LIFHALSVRNGAKFSPAVLEKPEHVLHDWQILVGLSRRLLARRGPIGKAHSLALGALERLGPRGMVEIAMRFGERRDGHGRLSLAKLRAAPHGIDLGPLEARLPKILRTPGRRIQFAPEPIVADLARLERRLRELGRNGAGRSLTLISRRQLRSNNSWMHN